MRAMLKVRANLTNKNSLKKFNYQNFSLFWYFAWERIRLANI